MLLVGQNEVTTGVLLFHDDFSKNDLAERWEISGGDWTSGGGVCRGVFRGNAGGLIYTKQQFPGDVLLDFWGTIIPPCDNDLNFSFRTRGWDYEKGDAATGYIAGFNGWYTKRAGIERYPTCALQSLVGTFSIEAGREYHIQAGIVGNTCFIAADGQVVVTLSDPDPITEPDCNRVGLGTYCSQIEFRDFKVYRPTVTHHSMSYVPKF